MAVRKAKDGVRKAAPAKARVAAPRKVASKAPALPVKAETAKAASPPAPIPAAVKEAVLPPAPAPIEVFAGTETVIEAVQEAVTTIQEQVEEGLNIMDTKTTQTVNAGKDAAKTAADQVQAVFGDFNERAKGAMEKNAKIVQEVTDLTKGNVEAIVASSRVAAKGFEGLSREAAEYGRKSFEDASTALKTFSEVRSPADLFRLQSDYARSYFDALVSETSKLSEQVIKLAGDVAEPITSRYSVAAEKVRSIAL